MFNTIPHFEFLGGDKTSSMKGITNQITFDGGSIQIVFGWLGGG
jgi:hypothetical protein